MNFYHRRTRLNQTNTHKINPRPFLNSQKLVVLSRVIEISKKIQFLSRSFQKPKKKNRRKKEESMDSSFHQLTSRLNFSLLHQLYPPTDHPLTSFRFNKYQEADHYAKKTSSFSYPEIFFFQYSSIKIDIDIIIIMGTRLRFEINN